MEMSTQEEQGGMNVAWEKWGKQTEGSRQTFTPAGTAAGCSLCDYHLGGSVSQHGLPHFFSLRQVESRNTGVVIIIIILILIIIYQT